MHVHILDCYSLIYATNLRLRDDLKYETKLTSYETLKSTANKI